MTNKNAKSFLPTATIANASHFCNGTGFQTIQPTNQPTKFIESHISGDSQNDRQKCQKPFANCGNRRCIVILHRYRIPDEPTNQPNKQTNKQTNERTNFLKSHTHGTRPDTRLPKSRAGGQGPYLGSLDHLGRSCGVTE